MSRWEYTPEESVGESFGIPMNKDNYYISLKQPSSDLIARAKLVLIELFTLLDRLDIEIALDSEQQVVVIYTEHAEKPDQWTVHYSSRRNAVIALDSYRAGTLTLISEQ